MSDIQLPQKQKAWQVVRKGLPKDAVVLNEQADVPSKLGPGDVLIKVQAAAFNPVGYKLMGLLPNFIAKRPYVAEHDFAGIVVNGNGTEFQNGQEVYGLVSADVTFKTQQGALQEYLVAPASHVVSRPANLKPTEAAGLALVGLTAYQCLFNIAKLEPGQSIFINGGSTSVGIAAIQLAKAIGCTVTVSASGQKEELLKSLGVDHFIDYKKAPVYKQLEENPPSPKFHFLLEAVGITDVTLYTHCEKYLAPGGIFLSVGPYPHGFHGFLEALHLTFEAFLRPKFLGGVKRKFILTTTLPFEDFKTYAQYVADSKVKPVVDSVFAFEDVQKAYDRVLSQHATGKVVVKVDPNVE
ncbi:hypothetical protein BDY19DRAFT_960779 [Irpex rosettiformis]|uniref:Uncharacterized protein n=1 Tax=Irpex rosettiformis TaxID=378272 RepID=A0ACB8TWF4_9APHY|nr:hypothetical protein BDY19DRAFT_960779 [Irpex rosettiformis]